uniref:Uncharacterized protein n=1 Tax=Proboscia inermis TaxID=420281 RepID=A0A7S0CC62_9STRA
MPFIDGTRLAQDAPVSALGGNTVSCQLVEVYIPPKLLRVSPLWAVIKQDPERGSTRVHLHGYNAISASLHMHPIRFQFSSVRFHRGGGCAAERFVILQGLFTFR